MSIFRLYCLFSTGAGESLVSILIWLDNVVKLTLDEYNINLGSTIPPAPLAKCSKASEFSTEQTITSSFRKMTPLPRTFERYKELTKAVCYFICKDQQPFDTVNDVGFRYMLGVFESRYTPPDCTTIASKYVPAMNSTLKEML